MKRLMIVGVATFLSCLALPIKAQDSKSDEPVAVQSAGDGRRCVGCRNHDDDA